MRHDLVYMSLIVAPARIGLVVGNGLTLATLAEANGGLTHWNSGAPFGWNINMGVPPEPVLDLHVTLGPLWRAARHRDPDASDFALLEKVLASAAGTGGPFRSGVAREARNYLALAFSLFQLRVFDKTVQAGYGEFSWARWLADHAPELTICVSYNYDLMLERLLVGAGVRAFRVGVEPPGGIPVVKPHSSIDFEQDAIFGSGNALIENCDLPQRILTADQMLDHRSECSLVLPGEPSAGGGLQWVKPGLDLFAQTAHKLTHVILVGLSYWPVDRPEIDALTDVVSKDATIVVANPTPSVEWLKRLASRHARVEVWRSGPREITR